MIGFFRNTVLGRNYRWWALGVIGLANFVATLDLGIINIGLPVITEYFDADMTLAGWIALIYAVVTAILYLPFGRLSDMIGRKRVLTAGFLLYSAGSAMAGSATSAGQLVFFRSLQAAGAALMTSCTFALITTLFSKAERGRAMGIAGGTVSALGFTVGPVVGGFLAHTVGWRFIFYLTFLLGVVGFVASQLILREEHPVQPDENIRKSFDLPGTFLYALGLGALMLALTESQKGNGTSGLVLAELMTAFLGLSFFLWWECRTPDPLLDPKLFRIRLFAAGNLARLLCFTATTMNSLLMPFLLQLVLGLTPLRAGYLLTANAVGLALVSPLSGWLSERVSATFLSSLGLAVMSVSFFFLSSLAPGATSLDVVKGLFLLGAGLGLFQAPNNNSVMSSVPVKRVGVASSFIAVVRSLGQSIGAAWAATMVTAALLAVAGRASLPGLQDASVQGDSILVLAFVEGYHNVHVTAGILCGIGVVTSLVRGSHRSPQGR